MKINEFIGKVNYDCEVVAKCGDSSIGVYDNESNLLFRIPLDATNFLEIDWSVMCADDSLSRKFSKHLSALIEEFLHTPVKERFPEKKYHLVAIPGSFELTGTYPTKYVARIKESMDSFSFVYGEPTIFFRKRSKGH